MKKIFLINPRQTGKTTKAIYEYLKSPSDSIYVNITHSTCYELCDKIDGVKNNFIRYDDLSSKLKGRKINNLILDDYLQYNNKEKIYEFINMLDIENLFIFSTSNKCYSKELIDYIKYNKYIYTFEEICEKKKYNEDDIYELYYNFLTDNDITIIDKELNHYNKKYLMSIIGKDAYNVEILNQYKI